MITSRRILVSAFAAGACMAFLAGCGQRGPLFLPTEPAAAQRASLPRTVWPPPGVQTPATSPPASTAPAAPHPPASPRP